MATRDAVKGFVIGVAAVAGRGGKVLVEEDQDLMRGLMHQALQEVLHGFTIRNAGQRWPRDSPQKTAKKKAAAARFRPT